MQHNLVLDNARYLRHIEHLEKMRQIHDFYFIKKKEETIRQFRVSAWRRSWWYNALDQERDVNGIGNIWPLTLDRCRALLRSWRHAYRYSKLQAVFTRCSNCTRAVMGQGPILQPRDRWTWPRKGGLSVCPEPMIIWVENFGWFPLKCLKSDARCWHAYIGHPRSTAPPRHPHHTRRCNKSPYITETSY